MLRISLFLAILLLTIATSQAEPSDSRASSALAPVDKNLLLFLGIESGIPSSKKDLSKCSGEETPLWIPKACHLATYLQQNNIPLRAILPFNIKTNIVYFGEVHLSQGAKHLMRDLLPSLKAQGFTQLGMEMFNAEQQNILDDFYHNKIDLSSVQEALKQTWNYESAGYMEIILAAKMNGIKILALDDRGAAPKIPLIENIHFRDIRMAERIANQWKKNPAEKIIVYAGSLHAQCKLSQSGAIHSQIEILSQNTGVSASCYTIREKMHTRDPITEIYFQTENNAPAFIPLNRETDYSDGYFLLPSDY